MFSVTHEASGEWRRSSGRRNPIAANRWLCAGTGTGAAIHNRSAGIGCLAGATAGAAVSPSPLGHPAGAVPTPAPGWARFPPARNEPTMYSQRFPQERSNHPLAPRSSGTPFPAHTAGRSRSTHPFPAWDTGRSLPPAVSLEPPAAANPHVSRLLPFSAIALVCISATACDPINRTRSTARCTAERTVKGSGKAGTG